MQHKNEQGWDPGQNLGLGVERKGNRVIIPETSESSKIEVDPQLMLEGQVAERREKAEAALPGELAKSLDQAERYMNVLNANRSEYDTHEKYVAKRAADLKAGKAIVLGEAHDSQAAWRRHLEAFDSRIGDQHRWTVVVRRASSAMERASKEAPDAALKRAKALLDEDHDRLSFELMVRHQNLVDLWQTANQLSDATVWETYNTKHREFEEDRNALVSIAEARQFLDKKLEELMRTSI